MAEARGGLLVADVYKAGLLAATIARRPDGVTEFAYARDYLESRGAPIAFSLPLNEAPLRTPGGGLPAFFSGLLPEGFRLTALQQKLKVSLDDELSLLLAVGSDTPGDTQVVLQGSVPSQEPAALSFSSSGALDFSTLRDGVDRRSLPGVQVKASAQMVSSPARIGGREFLLKLNPLDYSHLIENEYAHLLAARKLRLPVADAQLVTDQHGERGLLVSRFDRTPEGRSLGLEDGTQIMGAYPAMKYSVPTEDLVHSVAQLASAPLVAARNLYLQFLFAWFTGNGDLHAKNLSLVASRTVDLANSVASWSVAPLYDLPSTYIYGDTTMALPINGRTKNLRRRDWDALAATLRLPERAARSAQLLAGKAAASVDWASLPFSGSPVNGWRREMRSRLAELG